MGQPLRVLITGGSGFVGANLARAEVRAGNAVHLLLRPEARLWRLAGIDGQYIPQRADLRDAGAVRRVVASVRPEVIYHLATHGAYPAQKDRAAILAANLAGTLNLLDALAGHDYRALVHTGSSSEYGHKDRPIREDDVLEPRTDYAVGKAAATLLCLAEAFRGAPLSVVRIFSAFGPWEEPTRLSAYVLDACLRGVQARVSGAARARDYICVDDVIELIRLAARLPCCRGKILHAGRGVPCTVAQMVQAVHEVCGGPQPRFEGDDLGPGEPRHWLASIEATTALTGWTPRHDLRSGLERMKQWWLEDRGRASGAA